MKFARYIDNLRSLFADIKDYFNRNKYCNSAGSPLIPNVINVRSFKVDTNFYKSQFNCGDELSLVVVEWMLNRKGLSLSKTVKSTKLLVAIGSHFFYFYDDATIWGSGVRQYQTRRFAITKYLHFPIFQKLDIRSVRGPLTRDYLISLHHNCPKIYGDPAILMPLIFQPDTIEKKHEITIIPNYLEEKQIISKYGSRYNVISMNTNDYQSVISEIVCSKLVIASSLHAIILSECYGVPTIFYRFDKSRDIKYLDWYYSTNRFDVTICDTIDKAFKSSPMPLPENIAQLQKNIMEVFPYDLWNEELK